MKGIDRLLTYLAAALCGMLLWVGIGSLAGDWHRLAGLLAGGAGLVTVAVIILHRHWWGR